MRGHFDVLEAMTQQQRLHAMLVWPPPVCGIVGQFATRIKSHCWNIDLSKFQMSLDDQDIFGHAGDLCQGFNSIVTMIKNTQVENNVELTNCLRRETCCIDLKRLDVYAKRRTREFKRFSTPNMRM